MFAHLDHNWNALDSVIKISYNKTICKRVDNRITFDIIVAKLKINILKTSKHLKQ